MCLVFCFLFIIGIKVRGKFFKISEQRTSAIETQRLYGNKNILEDKTQTLMQSMTFYFFKSIIPLGLAPIYPKGPITKNLAFVLIMMLILFFIWKTAPPNLRVYIYAYFILVAPVLGIIKAPFMLQTPVSDQHAYLSLVPVLILLVSLVEKRLQKDYLKLLFYVLIFFSFSTLSINYSKSYRHEIKFYKAGLKSNPRAHFFRLNLAGIYASMNLRPMAVKEISQLEKFKDLNQKEKKTLKKIKSQISH
ncbi:MAG: hypothetical protein ACPGJV_10660 [Bacteriovoracaceae bacterium]